MIVVTMSFFSGIIFSCNVLRCVSMNSQECKIIPEIMNINSNEPLFCSYSIKIEKCSGSCNNINDSYWKICVSDVTKTQMLKRLI